MLDCRELETALVHQQLDVGPSRWQYTHMDNGMLDLYGSGNHPNPNAEFSDIFNLPGDAGQFSQIAGAPADPTSTSDPPIPQDRSGSNGRPPSSAHIGSNAGSGPPASSSLPQAL